LIVRNVSGRASATASAARPITRSTLGRSDSHAATPTWRTSPVCENAIAAARRRWKWNATMPTKIAAATSHSARGECQTIGSLPRAASNQRPRAASNQRPPATRMTAASTRTISHGTLARASRGQRARTGPRGSLLLR